jgi:pyridoxamine 5'-phosphate oxidase
MNFPIYYNDLDASLDKAWQLILDGAGNRKSAYHTPVVATLDYENMPQPRVMVLRGADRQKRRLRFHTDIRSSKITDVTANSNVATLFYDHEAKIQLRVNGTAIIDTSSAAAEQIWQGSDRFARRCYLAEAPPSSIANHPTSGLPCAVQGRKPDEEELVHGRQNFALFYIEVTSIDWLFLATEGHRRAKFIFDFEHDTWASKWLVP